MAGHEIVVYCAVFGGYDRVPPVIVPADRDRIAFVCLTDEAQDSAGWTYRLIHRRFADPRMESRRCFALSHVLFPDAKITIMHAGSLQLRRPPLVMVRRWLNETDIAAPKHPHRSCIYSEGQCCVKMKKAPEDKVEIQLARYRAMGYPAENGLLATTILLRRHTSTICEVNEYWWKELALGTCRDQLSLNFVLWRLGVPYNAVTEAYHGKGSIIKNRYWRWWPHG